MIAFAKKYTKDGISTIGVIRNELPYTKANRKKMRHMILMRFQSCDCFVITESLKEKRNKTS